MRKIVVSVSVGLILALTAIAVVQNAKSEPQSRAKAAKVAVGASDGHGNADSITEEELKIHLDFLASDQLEGRNLPSRGYDIAAIYIAAHLAEWGLKPGGSTTNTLGPLQPYLMPIELLSKQVIPAESKATLLAPAQGGRGGRGGAGNTGAAGSREPRSMDFEYGKEWTTGAGGRGGPPLSRLDVSGNLVFAGNGYVINKTNVNPYQGLDVRGKIIVVAGLPVELAAQQGAGRGRGGRGAATNPLGQSCIDFLTPEEYAARNGALAVVTVGSFQQIAAMSNPGGGRGGGGRGGALNGPAFQVPKLQQPAACPSAPSVTAGLEMTNAIFQGEKIDGSHAFYATGSNAKQDSFDLTAAKKLTLHLAVRSEEAHGENVVGILEGSDPVLKNEFVVMSAHLDHLGLSAPLPDGHNVFNGADDDGSGSAALIAMAHAFAEGAAKGMRPRRSVIFLWNAGEEKGLWGSQYFNEYPPVDLTKVVADLNMDMIGRTKGPGFTDPDSTHVLVNPGEILVVGPNISSDDLEKTIETVNESYQKLALNHFYDTTAPDTTHDNLGPQPNGQRIFYRSDHYNFARMGIPIAFFTTGLHPDYHRPTDTVEKIDFKEMQLVSRTVAAIAWTLGNQQGRPAVEDDSAGSTGQGHENRERSGLG